jgi:hypothetical protein
LFRPRCALTGANTPAVNSGAKCTKNQRFEIAELSGARSGWIGIEIGRTTL